MGGRRMKFNFEYIKGFKNMLKKIKECEGKHKQQVAFSSYHSSLTQVCFSCKKVRSNLEAEE